MHLIEKRLPWVGVFAGKPAGDLSASCPRGYTIPGVPASLMAPISPPLVVGLDLIGGLIDSLIDRMQSGNLEASGLLPQKSQGRSAILQCSTQSDTSRKAMRRDAQAAAVRPWVPGG